MTTSQILSETDSGTLLQRQYYARTAACYDEIQVAPMDEHAIALAWMTALVEQRGYASVLDVGSGTGRALLYLKSRSSAKVVGIEPSGALRAQGHAKGLSLDELVDGDACAIDYPENSFDLVCAYGVLHHIRDHKRAVTEMTRVAKHAVFISDANNFGQGSLFKRTLKQVLHVAGVWRLFDLVRTRGKGYHYSDGDGIYYSYSLVSDIPLIKLKFPETLYMSTRPSGTNLYRSAHTMAIFASLPRIS